MAQKWVCEQPRFVRLTQKLLNGALTSAFSTAQSCQNNKLFCRDIRFFLNLGHARFYYTSVCR